MALISPFFMKFLFSLNFPTPKLSKNKTLTNISEFAVQKVLIFHSIVKDKKGKIQMISVFHSIKWLKVKYKLFLFFTQ